MKHRSIISVLAFALVLESIAGSAASFDCNQAATEVEKLICSDTELSRLDDILVEEYRLALERTGNPWNLVLEQRKWLVKRNACNERTCLVDTYTSRLPLLQATPAYDQNKCNLRLGNHVDIENCPGAPELNSCS